MKIILSPRAKKQLKGVSRTAQIILTKKIRGIAVGSLVKEEKLSGYQNIYRIRVGDYRVVYKRTREEVFIILIGHRREIYRLLRELLR